MLPIIIRMNGMIFGLPWMKRVYGVSEEGRLRLRRMKLLIIIPKDMTNPRNHFDNNHGDSFTFY